jgi:hypothetical protein
LGEGSFPQLLFFEIVFVEVVLDTDLFQLLVPKEHLVLVFGTDEEAFLG